MIILVFTFSFFFIMNNYKKIYSNGSDFNSTLIIPEENSDEMKLSTSSTQENDIKKNYVSEIKTTDNPTVNIRGLENSKNQEKEKGSSTTNNEKGGNSKNQEKVSSSSTSTKKDNGNNSPDDDTKNQYSKVPEFIQGLSTPITTTTTTTGPWLTGPLIAKPDYSLAIGSLHFELFVSCDNIYGKYNNDWKFSNSYPALSRISITPFLQIGVNSFMDVAVTPKLYYDLTGLVEQPWFIGDVSLGLGFQLIGSSPFNTEPLLKIVIATTLPCGKFEFLDEKSKGADAAGGGSSIISIGMLGGKLYHLDDVHWLSTRGELIFSLPSDVHVHGRSVYGGDKSTKGIVRPGANLEFILSGEYTVTKNFALSLDIVNKYFFKTTFNGITIDPVGNDNQSYQLSLAPAIEWNVTQKFGIIGGFWFTVAGFNTSAFANGTIAFNWFF